MTSEQNPQLVLLLEVMKTMFLVSHNHNIEMTSRWGSSLKYTSLCQKYLLTLHFQ